MFKHGFALGALLGLGAAFVKDEHGQALKDAIHSFLVDEIATSKHIIGQSQQLQTQLQALNQQLPKIKASSNSVKQQVQAWQTDSQLAIENIKAALNKLRPQQLR